MTATPMTPAALATELGTDARTTRKFLRSITPRDAQPGKGSRWEIDPSKRSIASLRKKYAAFEKAQADAKALRDAAKAVEAPAVENDAETGTDDVETELEPTADELEAIDAE